MVNANIWFNVFDYTIRHKIINDIDLYKRQNPLEGRSLIVDIQHYDTEVKVLFLNSYKDSVWAVVDALVKQLLFHTSPYTIVWKDYRDDSHKYMRHGVDVSLPKLLDIVSKLK